VICNCFCRFVYNLYLLHCNSNKHKSHKFSRHVSSDDTKHQLYTVDLFPRTHKTKEKMPPFKLASSRWQIFIQFTYLRVFSAPISFPFQLFPVTTVRTITIIIIIFIAAFRACFLFLCA